MIEIKEVEEEVQGIIVLSNIPFFYSAKVLICCQGPYIFRSKVKRINIPLLILLSISLAISENEVEEIYRLAYEDVMDKIRDKAWCEQKEYVWI